MNRKSRNISLVLMTFIFHLKCIESSEVIPKADIKINIKIDVDVSKDCKDDLMQFSTTNLSIYKTWSNFSTLNKYGNSHNFGDFKGCQNFIKNEISTKYCLVQYSYSTKNPIAVQPSTSFYQSIWKDLDVSFLGAVCVPSSCSVRDVRKILENSFHKNEVIFGDKIHCKEEFKAVGNEFFGRYDFWLLKWLNTPRIIMLASIIIFTSVLQFVKNPKLKLINICKDSFDLSNNPSPTAYFNGLKSMNSIVIFMYHAWHARTLFPFKNGENLQKYTSGPLYTFLYSSLLVMDMFFIVGGILTARALRKGLKNSNKLKWIVKFYTKRLMRLVPVFVLVILFVLTTNTQNTSPYQFGIDVGDCKLNWWIFKCWSLYSNYARHLWFIPVYILLAIMSPYIFWLTHMDRYRNIFAILILILAALARFSVISFGFYNDYLKTFNASNFMDEKIYFTYISEAFRFYPFVCGLIIERFFDNKLFQINAVTGVAIFCTSIAIAIIFIVVISIPIMSSLMDLICNLTFMLFLYSCHNSEGLIKKILSKNFWMPISRMGLSIYLVSGYYHFSIHERELHPLEVHNEFHYIYFTIMDALKTSLPVFLAFILVEEPFSRIGDILAERI